MENSGQLTSAPSTRFDQYVDNKADQAADAMRAFKKPLVNYRETSWKSLNPGESGKFFGNAVYAADKAARAVGAFFAAPPFCKGYGAGALVGQIVRGITFIPTVVITLLGAAFAKAGAAAWKGLKGLISLIGSGFVALFGNKYVGGFFKGLCGAICVAFGTLGKLLAAPFRSLFGGGGLKQLMLDFMKKYDFKDVVNKLEAKKQNLINQRLQHQVANGVQENDPFTAQLNKEIKKTEEELKATQTVINRLEYSEQIEEANARIVSGSKHDFHLGHYKALGHLVYLPKFFAPNMEQKAQEAIGARGPKQLPPNHPLSTGVAGEFANQVYRGGATSRLASEEMDKGEIATIVSEYQEKREVSDNVAALHFARMTEFEGDCYEDTLISQHNLDITKLVGSDEELAKYAENLGQGVMANLVEAYQVGIAQHQEKIEQAAVEKRLSKVRKNSEKHKEHFGSQTSLTESLLNSPASDSDNASNRAFGSPVPFSGREEMDPSTEYRRMGK